MGMTTSRVISTILFYFILFFVCDDDFLKEAEKFCVRGKK
jgi:hypothetical protein